MAKKLRKLTYWCARCTDDSAVYNIRTKTKREALALLKGDGFRVDAYDPVKKVTVEYADAFDLVTLCLTEGGGHWEDV